MLGRFVDRVILQQNHPINEIEEIVGMFPSLPIVIDHCLYLTAKDGGHPAVDTLSKLSALAAFPNTHAKLTTCSQGYSNEPWPHRDTWQSIREVIAEFGADRCVWGSAFPQALWTPQNSYEENLKVFTEEIGLSAEEKAWILGRTALKLWFGGDPTPRM